MTGLVRIVSLTRQELILVTRDPTSLVVTILMPVLVIAFIRPTIRLSLVAQGYGEASGAEQTVPGMAVLFGFFLIGYVGLSFYREHVWGTWERLLVSPARKFEILVAKALPGLLQMLLQLGVLFGLGLWLFDLEVKGSFVALALIGVGLGLALVALALTFTAITRTYAQLSALSLLGAMVLGAMGGTLAPIALMPAWARAVAPITPSYWAMRGFNTVILEGGGVSAAAGSIGVLLGMAGGLLALGIFLLDFDQPKRL